MGGRSMSSTKTKADTMNWKKRMRVDKKTSWMKACWRMNSTTGLMTNWMIATNCRSTTGSYRRRRRGRRDRRSGQNTG